VFKLRSVPAVKETETSTTSDLEAKELVIPKVGDLPEQAPSRTKKLEIDRRTELNPKEMKRTINDPSSLLRKLERAPPTRELMAARQREIDGGAEAIFTMPMDDMLPEPLRELIQRTMHARKELTIPGVTAIPDEDALYRRLDSGLYQDQYAVPTGPEDDLVSSVAPSTEVTPETSLTVDTFPGLGLPGEIDVRPPGLRITKRTAAMHEFVAKRFTPDVPRLSFFEMMARKKKRIVAVAFFELLNIRSKNCINMEQEQPYEDIIITQTVIMDYCCTVLIFTGKFCKAYGISICKA